MITKIIITCLNYFFIKHDYKLYQTEKNSRPVVLDDIDLFEFNSPQLFDVIIIASF